MTHSKLLKLAGAAIAASAFALPVYSQSSTSGGTGASTDTSSSSGGASGRTYSENRSDNNRDWGWIGLLGLAGLAGLRKKHDDTYRGNVSRAA